MPHSTAIKELHNHVTQALQLLEEKKADELSAFLNQLHPVEVVSILNSVSPDLQPKFIKHVTGLDQLAGLISHAGDQLQDDILILLDDTRLAAVVRRLEVDDAAQLVSSFPRRKQVSVLKRVSATRARELTSLLAYEEETAGSIMTTLFLTFEGNIRVDDALRDLRQRLHDKDIDPDIDISYIYIVNSALHLRGVCSLREILSAEPDQRLEDLMISDPIHVVPDDDQETPAQLIADYDLSAIPVVEPATQKLLGIITVDDVLDVIEDEHTEDLLKLAGTVDEDLVGAKIPVAVRSRLPWLVASWFGGIFGAILLGGYSGTLEQVVALAFFMPVVFGMAGNVGSQSSTITVCGIVSGELGEYRSFGRFRKEATTGIMLGAIFGTLLAAAAFVLYRDPRLSLIVGTSILITMTCAAAFGAMLPLVFRRIGVDPAVASGPLVTTTTDILSIIIYFSVAGFCL